MKPGGKKYSYDSLLYNPKLINCTASDKQKKLICSYIFFSLASNNIDRATFLRDVLL